MQIPNALQDLRGSRFDTVFGQVSRPQAKLVGKVRFEPKLI